MHFRDIRSCGDNVEGLWNGYRPGVDYITFDPCYMDGHSGYSHPSGDDRGLATHEMGHAVGLGDHTLSDYGGKQIIMYYCPIDCQSTRNHQPHDRSDYYKIH